MKQMKFMAVAMLMAATATATVSCGGDSKDNEDAKGDSTAVVGDTVARKATAHAPSTNIRYINLDSILANYTYAVQESGRMQKKAMELQQLQNNLATNLQKRASEIEKKAQSNGYLTQQSYEADMSELNKLDQSSSQQYAARAQAVQNEAAKAQQNVYNAIRNYIIEYNKEKKYDAILFSDAGMYFNPALDITKEIIDGLNATATPVAK